MTICVSMAGLMVIAYVARTPPSPALRPRKRKSRGYAQNAVSTYLFSGSKLELYDAIMAGHVEMEDLGVTMEAE